MAGGVNNFEDSAESTEEDILSQVEGITGDSFDEEQDTANEPDEEEDNEEEQGKQRRTRDENADETRQSRDDASYQRVDRREVQSRIPSQRRVDYDYDRQTGDVIDPKTGNVIFKNGTVEREMFTSLQDAKYNEHRMRSQATELIGRYKNLEAQVEEYKRAPNLAKQAGISDEQHVQALTYMGEYAKNPVGALRKMLTQAQSDGVDLSEIFDNLPAIQRDGVLAQLESRLSPLLNAFEQRQTQQTQSEELTERLNKDITSFFESNPEAEQHGDVLADIINAASKRGIKMGLNDAYMHLLRHANKTGLDLTRPVREQLQQSEQPRREERQQRTPSLPRGRGDPGMRRARTGNKPDYERSTKDLLAEAFEESGIPLYS